MITIPAETIVIPAEGDNPESSYLTPAQVIPTNAIAVVCNGTEYTVYEPGDTVPGLIGE